MRISFSRRSVYRGALCTSALIFAGSAGCGDSSDPSDPLGAGGGSAVSQPANGGAATGGTITPGGGTAGGSVSGTGTTIPATGGGVSGGSLSGGSLSGGVSGPVDAGTTVVANPGGGDLWCNAKAVIDARCVACHDGQGTGGSPMGLTSYADLTADSTFRPGKKVWERVGVRIHADQAKAEGLGPMPAKADMTAEQIAAIDAWVSAGAPAGASATCATPEGTGGDTGGGVGPDGKPAAVWDPSQCDEVYPLLSHGTGSSKFSVSPGESHPSVTLDAPWGNEDVQAINFHPISDNKAVLHHWILYGGGFLAGWAPGDDARQPFPDHVGMQMPKGAGSLRLDMHYYNQTGSVQQDASGVEVCIVKGANLRPDTAAVTMSFTVAGFPLAPANNPNYDATSTCNVTASKPVHLMTAGPHAHKYAKWMKFTVKKKDGTEIVMHDHAFNFGEQGTYPLEPEVIIESGDQVITTCTYSNTTSRNINFGESTDSEMCFNFAAYYPAGGFSCGLGGLLGGGGFLGGN